MKKWEFKYSASEACQQGCGSDGQAVVESVGEDHGSAADSETGGQE
jgi:hypothetical protein